MDTARPLGRFAAAGPEASGSVVVVTADQEVLDSVLAVIAAAGRQPEVLSSAGAVRAVWRRAAVVIVGVDRAPEVVEWGLPPRDNVFVVGDDNASGELCLWSAPLHAAVVSLPSGATWLTSAAADAAAGGRGAGQIIAVVGGSGGVGVSTLAAGLAATAGRVRSRALLVDLDPLGGGLDLLVGAERRPGWRWSRLAHARGHLGELAGQLPGADGLDTLSMARGDGSSAPDPPAVKAVLASASRSYAVTVVDCPRRFDDAVEEVLRRADHRILLASAEVRGVAAAREVLHRLEQFGHVGLLVRRTRIRTVEPAAVADSLGLALLGTIADDPSLISAADRGEPPGRVGRSPLARVCEVVLAGLPSGVSGRAA